MDGMLSQEEIDALLLQTREATGGSDLSRPSSGDQDVKLYDFKHPEKFSREQLRSLERVHERMARLLSTSLSSYLRTNVSVRMESVTPLSYQDFVFSLPQPTLIQVIELEPLTGQAAIEINPSVVFPMFEQMLGGKVGSNTKARMLTDIELELFKRALDRMLQCLAETWQGHVELRPVLVRHEQDPQFAQVAATNTPVLAVSFEITMGDDFGMMSLCLPDVLVEALLGHLGAERALDERPGADREAHLVRRALTDVPLPVSAELGLSRLTVRQVRALAIGDVIKLTTPAGSDVTVRVANRTVFRGRVGQLRSRLAVRVTGLHEREDPLAAVAAEVLAEAEHSLDGESVEATPVAVGLAVTQEGEH